MSEKLNAFSTADIEQRRQSRWLTTTSTCSGGSSRNWRRWRQGLRKEMKYQQKLGRIDNYQIIENLLQIINIQNRVYLFLFNQHGLTGYLIPRTNYNFLIQTQKEIREAFNKKKNKKCGFFPHLPDPPPPPPKVWKHILGGKNFSSISP